MRWAKWSIVALAVVGLGACERAGAAQERKSSRPPAAKQAPTTSADVPGQEDASVFRGTVTVVTEDQFVVRGPNGVEEPFVINPQTDFFHRGQTVERKQLQEGDQVRTRFDEHEGKKIADEVEIY